MCQLNYKCLIEIVGFNHGNYPNFCFTHERQLWTGLLWVALTRHLAPWSHRARWHWPDRPQTNWLWKYEIRLHINVMWIHPGHRYSIEDTIYQQECVAPSVERGWNSIIPILLAAAFVAHTLPLKLCRELCIDASGGARPRQQVWDRYEPVVVFARRPSSSHLCEVSQREMERARWEMRSICVHGAWIRGKSRELT